jgi:hypothetical protein
MKLFLKFIIASQLLSILIFGLASLILNLTVGVQVPIHLLFVMMALVLGASLLAAVVAPILIWWME